eukprot:Rmarinus@m.24511
MDEEEDPGWCEPIPCHNCGKFAAVVHCCDCGGLGAKVGVQLSSTSILSKGYCDACDEFIHSYVVEGHFRQPLAESSNPRSVDQVAKDLERRRKSEARLHGVIRNKPRRFHADVLQSIFSGTPMRIGLPSTGGYLMGYLDLARAAERWNLVPLHHARSGGYGNEDDCEADTLSRVISESQTGVRRTASGGTGDIAAAMGGSGGGGGVVAGGGDARSPPWQNVRPGSPNKERSPSRQGQGQWASAVQAQRSTSRQSQRRQRRKPPRELLVAFPDGVSRLTGYSRDDPHLMEIARACLIPTPEPQSRPATAPLPGTSDGVRAFPFPLPVIPMSSLESLDEDDGFPHPRPRAATSHADTRPRQSHLGHTPRNAHAYEDASAADPYPLGPQRAHSPAASHVADRSQLRDEPARKPRSVSSPLQTCGTGSNPFRGVLGSLEADSSRPVSQQSQQSRSPSRSSLSRRQPSRSPQGRRRTPSPSGTRPRTYTRTRAPTRPHTSMAARRSPSRSGGTSSDPLRPHTSQGLRSRPHSSLGAHSHNHSRPHSRPHSSMSMSRKDPFDPRPPSRMLFAPPESEPAAEEAAEVLACVAAGEPLPPEDSPQPTRYRVPPPRGSQNYVTSECLNVGTKFLKRYHTNEYFFGPAEERRVLVDYAMRCDHRLLLMRQEQQKIEACKKPGVHLVLNKGVKCSSRAMPIMAQVKAHHGQVASLCLEPMVAGVMQRQCTRKVPLSAFEAAGKQHGE